MGWTSTPFQGAPLRTFVILVQRQLFVRVGRLGTLMQGLQMLVDGIVLGGVLFMTRGGGFRLGMRLVMLSFVGVDLRGGGERECWIDSDYSAR
jgi:hypothetical protein